VVSFRRIKWKIKKEIRKNKKIILIEFLVALIMSSCILVEISFLGMHGNLGFFIIGFLFLGFILIIMKR
jgi:hypothetical protein